MNSIKYSIIVPVFNNQIGVDNIVKSLGSLAVIDEKVELIIVDDGSTVPIIVNETKGVRLIRQNNTGVSGARNHGIRVAKGTYVSFLDSDDAYDMEVISTWDSVTRKSENAALFIFEYKVCDRINDKTTYQKHKLSSGLYSGSDALKHYFEKLIFSHICSLLIEREFLIQNAITFNQGLALSEDVLFAIDCIFHANWVYVSEDHYFSYIIQQGTATNVVATEKVLNHFDAFKEIEKVDVPNDTVPYRNFFIATMYLNFLLKLISNKTSSRKVVNRTVESRGYLKKSFKGKFSVRFVATIGFKIISYLPSPLLEFLLSKCCLRRHEY